MKAVDSKSLLYNTSELLIYNFTIVLVHYILCLVDYFLVGKMA